MDSDHQPVFAPGELTSTSAIADVLESPGRKLSAHECKYSLGMDYASGVRRESYNREILEARSKQYNYVL